MSSSSIKERVERQGVGGTSETTLPEAPWASTPEAVLDALGVSAKDGLHDEEVASRRRRFGRNRLRAARTASAWALLLDQFLSLIVRRLGAVETLGATNVIWS